MLCPSMTTPLSLAPHRLFVCSREAMVVAQKTKQVMLGAYDLPTKKQCAQFTISVYGFQLNKGGLGVGVLNTHFLSWLTSCT